MKWLIRALTSQSRRALELIRAESSSKGSCRSRRAPRSSTLVSHQISPGGTAQTQTTTRGTLRLRAVNCSRLLFGATCPWMCTSLRLKGGREASSPMADRSVCGSAIPSWDTILPQVALFASHGLLASLFPREPADPAGSSLRRRRALCLWRCGGSTVARLRFVLAIVFQAPGGDTPGELSTWSRRGCRTGFLRRRNGQRTCWTSTSLLPVFSRECFNRNAAGTDRLSTP